MHPLVRFDVLAKAKHHLADSHSGQMVSGVPVFRRRSILSPHGGERYPQDNKRNSILSNRIDSIMRGGDFVEKRERKEYLGKVKERHRKAKKPEKIIILDAFTKTTGYDRNMR